MLKPVGAGLTIGVFVTCTCQFCKFGRLVDAHVKLFDQHDTCMSEKFGRLALKPIAVTVICQRAQSAGPKIIVD